MIVSFKNDGTEDIFDGRNSRKNLYSIRINQQYRICFIWKEGYAYEVEITDYH